MFPFLIITLLLSVAQGLEEKATVGPATQTDCARLVRAQNLREQLTHQLEIYWAPPDPAALNAFKKKSELLAWLTEAELKKMYRLKLKRTLTKTIKSFHIERARYILNKISIKDSSLELVSELVRLQLLLQYQHNSDDIADQFSWDRILSVKKAQQYLSLYFEGKSKGGAEPNRSAIPGNLKREEQRAWKAQLLEWNFVDDSLLTDYILERIVRGDRASHQVGFRTHCCNGGCTTCAWGFPELTTAKERRNTTATVSSSDQDQ